MINLVLGSYIRRDREYKFANASDYFHALGLDNLILIIVISSCI